MYRFGSLKSYIFEGARAGCIMGSGDVLAQTVVEKKTLAEVDLIRTMKYGSLGFLVVGPALKFWYTLLEHKIAGPQNMKRTVKKVLIDQTTMAPAMNLTIAALVGLINNEKPRTISARLRTQYPDIMKTNYLVWPAAQIINFSFVPLQYQVVFVQVVAIFWNCFVSQLLNKKIPDLVRFKK